MTERETDGSEGTLHTVEVTATGLMGVDVQPDETVEEAVQRELAEEMTAERARSFIDDANINFDDLGEMGDQEEVR